MKRWLVNVLVILSLMLALVAAGLWVRSPGVFDRVSWTTGAGRLWEVTSVWGDLAVVRVEGWPEAQGVWWRAYGLGASVDTRFQAIADCDFYKWESEHGPGPFELHLWGRGLSVEQGIMVKGPMADVTPRYVDLPFKRWTVPLWTVTAVLAALPLARVGGWMWRRGWVRRAGRWRGVIPWVPVVLMLLLWWHSYWYKRTLIWNGNAQAWEISLCRGLVIADRTPPLRPPDPEREKKFREAMSEGLSIAPSSDHTYRRNRRQWGRFIADGLTLEPDPWDLTRADLPLVIDWPLQESPAFPSVREWLGRSDGGWPRFQTSCFVPMWVVVLAAGLWPGWRLVASVMARRRAPKPRHCVKCNYDLRASRERCPECGTPVPEGHVVKVAVRESERRGSQ